MGFKWPLVQIQSPRPLKSSFYQEPVEKNLHRFFSFFPAFSRVSLDHSRAFWFLGKRNRPFCILFTNQSEQSVISNVTIISSMTIARIVTGCIPGSTFIDFIPDSNSCSAKGIHCILIARTRDSTIRTLDDYVKPDIQQKLFTFYQ